MAARRALRLWVLSDSMSKTRLSGSVTTSVSVSLLPSAVPLATGPDMTIVFGAASWTMASIAISTAV